MAAGAYDAFISYSHGMDGQLAPALRSGLEQLAKPWRRRRALRVFHDVSGLGATPGLWSKIASVLDHTRYFLLLASPAAAKSVWVQQEVDYFRRLRGAEAIFLVLTSGDCKWDATSGDFDWTVSSALPVQLSGAYHEEPLSIDLRWARDDRQLDLRNARFRQAIGDLAAPIHGLPRDELDALDLIEFQRARRARRMATTALAGLTAVATIAAGAAITNAQRARTQQLAADAGRLAALSVGYAAERTDLGVLLAMHSLRRTETREGRIALATSMTRPAAAYGPVAGSEQLGLALAAGGDLVVAGSSDGRIAVWEAQASGAVHPRELRRAEGAVTELSLEPGGGAVASVDLAGSLVVQSVSGVTREPAPQAGVADVTYAPDGRLVTVGLDGSVAMLDAGRTLWRRRGVSPKSTAVSTRAAAAVSLDGRWIGVATADARIVLLNAANGQIRDSWPTGGSDANDLAFDPSSTQLVAGGDDGVARVWAIPGHRQRAEFGGPLDGIRRVAWAPDGSTFVTGAFDGRARLYDPVARRPIGDLTGHSWAVTGLAYAGHSRMLLTADTDGVLSWNLNTGRPDRQLRRQGDPVIAARFAGDGSVLATQSVAALELRRPGMNFEGAVTIRPGGYDVALSANGSTAAIAGPDNLVRMYDTAGRLLSSFGSDGPLWGVDLTADGTLAVTVAQDGQVAVHRVADGATIWRRAVLRDGYKAVFTPDRSALVAIGLKDPVVVLLNATTGQELARWASPRQQSHPTAVAVTPDGRQLVVGSSDGRLDILDAVTLSPLRSLLAHQNKVYSVAVSPDGSMIATGGFNGGRISQSGFDPGLRLWDLSTGQKIGQLVAHDGQVEALAFSPDGRWLVSAGFDGRVFAWPAIVGWREAACEVARRDLHPDERALLLAPDDTDQRVCQ